MPAKSRKQRNLMMAAMHGADFPMAQKVRESMSTAQLADYAKLAPKRETKRKKRK